MLRVLLIRTINKKRRTKEKNKMNKATKNKRKSNGGKEMRKETTKS